MPRHSHTVALETMLSETERLLVRWLLHELNAIRSEVGMPVVTSESLDAMRRDERARQRQYQPQER